MEIGFHHFAVSVPDLEAAMGWYGEILGFAEEFRFGIPATQAVMLRRGNLRIELFLVDGSAPLPEGRSDPRVDIETQGNKHAAFTVPDLTAALAELEAKGVKPAYVQMEGVQRIAFIRDCFGNLIELVEAS